MQEHAVSDGHNDYKIEVTERLTPAAYLGVLGLTGIDVRSDNVGGEILDEGLARLNRGARAVICGAISQ